MGNSEQVRAESGELVGDILRTPELVQAEICSGLLRILLEHSDNPVGISGKELAELLYKQKAHGDRDQAFRQLVMELRLKLRRYSATEEGQRQKWCCLLPNGISGQGYRLRFINQWSLPGPTGHFWQAHREGGRLPIVVFTEPLFFVEKAGNRLFRWPDVNHDDATPEEALRLLKEKHPEVDTTGLHPSYSYLASGEIKAQQYIQDWFAMASGGSVPARNARRITSSNISSTSPVLLGTPEDNRLMRHLLDLGECKQLRYRYDCDGSGLTLLMRPTADEQKRLALLPGVNVRRGNGHCELVDTAEADRYVFGVLTRMPNPYGEGCVTIISAHQTRAVEQCAKSLTDDSRIRRLLSRREWSWEEPAPRFFEALFAVRMGPVNVDAEARIPELIGMQVHQLDGLGEACLGEGEALPALHIGGQFQGSGPI